MIYLGGMNKLISYFGRFVEIEGHLYVYTYSNQLTTEAQN